VAAVSARDAWAVGSTSLGVPLIFRWNGRTWKRVPSPNPSPVEGTDLNGVTALSARNAWAVGGTRAFRTLILHWNGSAWK
jgi:hypothetical protein